MSARKHLNSLAGGASLPHDIKDVLAGTYRFIALDVETANRDASSICQIGIACVPEDGPCIMLSELIDPQQNFEYFNIELHGISETSVEGAPIFPVFMAHFLPLLSRHTIVQHSRFDQKAMGAACAAHGMPEPALTWIDSVTIARRAWPEFRGNGGHGLGNLKKELGLEFEHHDAGEDAYAASQVVVLAEDVTGQTFDDLSAPKPKRAQKQERRDGAADGVFAGQSVVFSGTFNMARKQIANKAHSAGFAVRSSVSRKTTYVVAGQQKFALFEDSVQNAALTKAEALIRDGHSLQILSETQFIQILGRAGSV